MPNDPVYREEVLLHHKTERDQKRKEIENDPLHSDARKNADRMIKVRRMAREIQETENAQERQNMIEKVH